MGGQYPLHVDLSEGVPGKLGTPGGSVERLVPPLFFFVPIFLP